MTTQAGVVAVDAETVASVRHRPVIAAAGSSASARRRPGGTAVAAVRWAVPGAGEVAAAATRVPAVAHPYRASQDVRDVAAGSPARLCLMALAAVSRAGG